MVRMLLALPLCAASSALAGGGHVLTVSAAGVSNNSCRFLTAASTVNLGAIDPAGTAPVSASPQTGTIFWGIPRTIAVTTTVAAADYQDARPGAYSDTVVLSLLP